MALGKYFLTLILLSSPLWADTGTKTETPVQDFWRLILDHKKPVGYTFLRITPLSDSDVRARTIHFETRLDVRYHQSRLKGLFKVLDATLDPDHGGFLNFKIVRNPAFSEKVEGRMENGNLHLTVYRGKKSYTQDMAVSGPVYLLDYLNVPIKFCFVGSQTQISVFNDITLSLESMTIHCVEKVSLEREGKSIPAIKTSYSMGSYHCVNYLDEQGRLIHFESERARVQIVASTEDEVRHTPFESRSILPSLPGTAELLSSGTRKRLTLRIQPLYAGVSLRIPENERQRVTQTGDSPPGYLVTIRSEPKPLAVSPSEPDPKNAAPTFFEEPIAGRLQAIAEWMQKKGKNDFERAVFLNHWVYQTVVYKESPAWLSPEEILNAKKGDCKAHALLFSSIAKFLRLPTRFCVGLVHMDKKFWGHVWLKAFVNGKWITLDPTFDQVCVDATHLCLLEGTDDRELFFDFNLVAECLQECRIEIVESGKS